jgi:hypothetical protein
MQCNARAPNGRAIIYVGSYVIQSVHGSGLSPVPTPLFIQTLINIKYICYGIVNKEQRAVLWLAESYEVFT